MAGTVSFSSLSPHARTQFGSHVGWVLTAQKISLSSKAWGVGGWGEVAVTGGDGCGVSSKDLGKGGKQEETSPEAGHTPTVPLFPPPAPSTSVVPLSCPTCVALGACPAAPSLPCPNDTTECYEGRLQIYGGKLNVWWFSEAGKPDI